MCVIKRINFRSLDRDSTVAMRFGALNRGRHNSALKSTCLICDPWTARRFDQRSDRDPTLRFTPRHLHLNKPVGFIRPDGLVGLNTLPIYGRLNTPTI